MATDRAPLFSRLQRRVLIACAVVLVLAGGILAVDALFVRAAPATGPALSGSSADPAVAQAEPTLASVAHQLGLVIDEDPATARELHELMAAVPELGAAEAGIGPVLARVGADHRLWLFEVQVEQTLMVGYTGSAQRQHTGELSRLAIVLRLDGAQLPSWHQDQSTPAPAPPWTPAALARLARIEDLHLASHGPYLVAVARPGRIALLEKVQRERSVEFHPGLLNSALAIDTQRVIDVANLLDTARAPVPRIYAVQVEVRLPETGRPDLGAGMRSGRAAMQADIERLRAERAQQHERYRAVLAEQAEAARTRRDRQQQETAPEPPADPGRDRPATGAAAPDAGRD
jgi:hypothetical protein